MRLKIFFGYMATALLTYASTALSASPETDKWTALFNGKNLDGWYTYTYLDRGDRKLHGKNNDAKGIFKVENGMIHVFGLEQTGEKQPYGYVATNDEYSDVRLHVEYKYGTKRFPGYYEATGEEARNSGVIYLMAGPDENPRAVECQIEESNTGDMELWGTAVVSKVFNPDFPVYDMDSRPHPLGHHGDDLTRIIKSGAFENLDGWNTIEVVINGDRVKQIVNGRVVNMAWDIKQPDPRAPSNMIPLTRGHIALQEEGAEIWFRNVKIRPLTAAEKNADALNPAK